MYFLFPISRHNKPYGRRPYFNYNDQSAILVSQTEFPQIIAQFFDAAQAQGPFYFFFGYIPFH
ncbi:MAG: hypothetical protein A2855_02420 [Candidatus Liptonbacteria bacterium RIFCSPHIGHO2_01_FULL_57_28]|uniref:Uncharacterized protein n=1 Tax=Candidatus Liptonbacteria bacterium RIFCSPHIGHO2_01_FULL_57_28 TaxID=1798647 RepID=A0A1G2C9C3_9BACT|nr:MAG: hypothetical protein A2855_02420 [Candidatus Liptonbacteria bacterium RIFCSPHIGHO2_01_FULL_57_28]